MKVQAPLMRTRRVVPSRTLDHQLLPSIMPDSRKLDAGQPSSPTLHELDAIDAEPDAGDRSTQDDSTRIDHHDAAGFGPEPIQRARNGKKKDERTKKKRENKESRSSKREHEG